MERENGLVKVPRVDGLPSSKVSIRGLARAILAGSLHSGRLRSNSRIRPSKY